jgi:integral membrane sensor domain MASE1
MFGQVISLNVEIKMHAIIFKGNLSERNNQKDLEVDAMIRQIELSINKLISVYLTLTFFLFPIRLLCQFRFIIYFSFLLLSLRFFLAFSPLLRPVCQNSRV